MHALNADGYDNVPTKVYLVTYPDECPLCHVAAQFSSCIWAYRRNQRELEGLFRCPRHECQRLLIAEYVMDSSTGYHHLTRTKPQAARAPIFDPEVKAVSASFVEIFTQ
ncbi:MAG: hypothetical protein AAB152_16100 [Candidatus Coatesbacteria bacterium]